MPQLIIIKMKLRRKTPNHTRWTAAPFFDTPTSFSHCFDLTLTHSLYLTERTWTSHHPNLTLAELQIWLPKTIIHKPLAKYQRDIHATSASHNLQFMLRQLPTSQCTNPNIIPTLREQHWAWTSHWIGAALPQFHIRWTSYYTSNQITSNSIKVVSTSHTPPPHCLTISNVLSLYIRIGTAPPTTKFDRLNSAKHGLLLSKGQCIVFCLLACPGWAISQ